jgi:vitamin B12 transporter
MPTHTIGASVDIPWKIGPEKYEGSLLISGHYESLRYAEVTNITELAPYFLLNLTVNQRVGKNLTAYTIIRNALNTSYESFYDYPMPGITLTLGMRFNLEPNREKPRD